jgi:hypothetical protein
VPTWDDLSEEDRETLADYIGSFDLGWSEEQCRTHALEIYMAIKFVVERQ